MARVVKRIKGNNGKPYSGPYNPILDQSQYLVEFTDGTTKEVYANIIAESMFSDIDSESHHYQILKEIVGHEQKNNAISKENGYCTSHNGNRVPKCTTKGWEFMVEWADESTSMVPLKDLKVSNPVEVAEYVTANNLEEKPAFKW